MKTKPIVLTLILGLAAGVLACQDQAVLAPEGLHPQFAKGGKKPPPSEVTIHLTGFLTGNGEEGEWSYKKGVFKGWASVPPPGLQADFSALEFGDCVQNREGADADEKALALFEAIRDGLGGTTANLKVDMATAGIGPGGEGTPSDINRITSLVATDLVRYFWVGSWPSFVEDPTVEDAVVNGFDDVPETISYTLEGGAIVIRDQGRPNQDVMIACPNPGTVHVTITK